MMTSEKTEHLKKLIDLAEAGGIKPFIDREFCLNAIVEAHRYVDSGRKRGNVVITISA
jgi:NADPH:quinone reductase-like Zn-dependent oxidoreductase